MGTRPRGLSNAPGPIYTAEHPAPEEHVMSVWKENYFSVDERRRLFYRTCLPEKSQGLVLVLHGYADWLDAHHGA
jgi:hypothetical protein